MAPYFGGTNQFPSSGKKVKIIWSISCFVAQHCHTECMKLSST